MSKTRKKRKRRLAQVNPGPAPTASTGFRVSQEMRPRPIIYRAQPEEQSSRVVRLPSAAQFGLILLSRKYRDDVLNDLGDWYPGWVVEHHGRLGANFVCFWKIAGAFLWQALDVLHKIGEVFGKFRGAK